MLFILNLIILLLNLIYYKLRIFKNNRLPIIKIRLIFIKYKILTFYKNKI